MYRVGIVGCGNIFPMHAVSILRTENARIVAVSDIKTDRGERAAKDHNCNFYTDYKEMIEKESLDVLHICTPHYLHAPIAIYAFSKGLNVLTEKPMSIKLEDAKEMVEAGKKANKTFGVIFQNRYNPGAKLIKKCLTDGTLGKVLGARASVTWQRTDEYYQKSDWKGTWDKEGGGVVIDQAIHTLDMMNWLIADEIDYIEAAISNRAHEIIEVEDSAEGVIKYKNGVVAGFYTVNYYSYDAPVSIEMHCEKGIATIISDRGEVKLNDGRTFIADREDIEIDYGHGVKSYWGVSHIKQIKNFYDALEKGIDPDITGEIAYKTQKMICGIYESGKNKNRVKY